MPINSINPDSARATAPALSRFWARNRGLSEAAALANLLKSLRKVAGHLGPNVGQVLFPGMSFPDSSAIVIDPSPARNHTYPLPFPVIDGMVGRVVHEAYRKMEWSRRVWILLEPYMKTLGGRETVRFQKMVDAAETVYLDLAAARTIAGDYAAKARQEMLHQYLPRQNDLPANLDTLLLRWIQSAAENFEKTSVPQGPELESALGHLQSLTPDLKRIAAAPRRPTERCRERAGLYQKSWSALAPILMKLPIRDKTLLFYPEYQTTTGSPPVNSKQANPPLPASLVREMELQLSAGSLDLTPVIFSVAGYDNPDVVRMSRWDFNQPCRPVIDRRLVARLRSVFLNYGPRRKVTSRGLTAGKIDPRRLYRAPVTGKCFQEQYTVSEERWQISLLVDASGSMRGNKIHIVENTVANLSKAVGAGQNRLTAYAYFEVNKICMFSRLLANGRLFTVPPAGKTASGQAIIAAAWMMERGRGRRRNLLIHITDGESNFGCDVQHGIDYCRRENIRLITLGCGCPDRQAMTEQYGHTIQFLKSYEHLPQALERLFKRLFLYRK